MAKTKSQVAGRARPQRAKLTAAQAMKRMKEFPKRKEQFIAAVRKGKDRSLSA